MKMTWYEKDIWTLNDINEFVKTYKKSAPNYGGFDTETNGLNIIKNKPFILVFGIADKELVKGYTFALDLERTTPFVKTIAIQTFINYFNKLKKVLAWNAKYDLHMMTNVGFPELFQHNITDVQIYVRLAHDAIPERFGGVSMKLKNYAKKYIDPNATIYASRVTAARKVLRSNNNKILQQKLLKATGKKYPLYHIEDVLKDNIIGIEGFPKKIRHIVQDWINNTPDPDDYSNLDRDLVMRYAHKDVVYTIEAFIKTYPIAIEREQEKIIEEEEALIYPLYHMERVGFAFNKKYALESKEKLKNFILEQRKLLEEYLGENITANQHDEIKKRFLDEFNIDLPSTGAKVLESITFTNVDAQNAIDVIQTLRTLEKWYVTYIVKWINEEVNGRVYTTIHQTGAVSGRVTSDFQQFPQGAIYDKDGNELFHPRKLIQVTGGKYNKIAYLDYSQMELRFQAIYTILVSGGDVNLCRAYIPFKCHKKDGEWYLDENPEEKWEPTDLHSLTTKLAFGVDESHTDWKKLRKMGKQTNFACNYGSVAKGLHDELNFDMETARKMYKAYLTAFPDIQKYRDYIKIILAKYPYIENLFGRKYYGANAHKCSNYIIQGSGADFLKRKIIEIHNFLKPYNTRFQMNIHDELSFEIYDGEEFLIPQLKDIMESLEGTPVPITADAEITYTTWAEKVDYDTES